MFRKAFWRRARGSLVRKHVAVGSDRNLAFGVAMCFEKRFGVGREEASSENVLPSVAIETSRSFIRGRRQWPQASQSADPGGPAWGWACHPGDRKLSVREVQ